MSDLYVPRSAGTERAQLGESPFWHPQEQVLYYCDIPAGRLHRFDPASGEAQRWQFDCDVACCVPIESGGLLLARRDGLFRFDVTTGRNSKVADSPCPDPSIERFNDGKCDSAGRFWCGTVYEPKSPPLASLYCVEGGIEGTDVQKRADAVTTSNGLAWSPDGRTMYWSDTPAHTIFALDYDVATGRIGERRVFKRFALRDAALPAESYQGRPDGGAVDSAGNYWAAMFEGGRLIQLAPDGEVIREVLLPVRCPTMPCFGGADLKTLYVTTASFKRPDAELAAQPQAGCVLAIDVEIPGPSAEFYRG